MNSTMSTDSVEKINDRLREEFVRLGFTLAAAARAAGETTSQRIKDVVSGKQRCPIDLLARLDGIGVDIFYVITGRRQDGEERADAALGEDERALLAAFRSSSASGKRALKAMGEALAERREKGVGP